MISPLSPISFFFIKAKFLQGKSWISGDGLVAFRWRVVDNEWLEVTFQFPESGYFGWGVSLTGNMKGADIALLFPAEKKLLDCYGVGHVHPKYDATNNVKLLSLSQTNGVVKCTMRRPLLAWDRDEDLHIARAPITVIYAYVSSNLIFIYHQCPGIYDNSSLQGDCDLSEDGSLIAKYHNVSGQVVIDFFDDTYNVDGGEDEVLQITLSPKLPVPVKEKTVYTHFLLELKNEEPLHIIGHNVHKGLKNPKGILLVHHFTVSLCQNCEDLTGELDVRQILNYNAGMAPLLFPRVAGVYLPRRAALIVEVHITGDLSSQFQTDTSELELFLTPDLRKYNMSQFVVGANVPKIKPGKGVAVVTTKVAASAFSICGTHQDTIEYFRHGFHQHTHGLGLLVSSSKRRGSEANYSSDEAVLSYENGHMWDSGQYTPPAVKSTVSMSDVITVRCFYDRKSYFHNGQSVHDEMCYDTALVYPCNEPSIFCENGRCRHTPEMEECESTRVSFHNDTNITNIMKRLNFRGI